MIRRVDYLTGREMFPRKNGDCAGIVIPNVFPGDGQIREYRLRLDNPPIEYGIDGSKKEKGKYLSPPGRGCTAYFPPTMPAALLKAPAVTVIITEGEFKCLALWDLANTNSPNPRFIPMAFPGVWNFRGVIGKTDNERGIRVDVKGVTPDIERVTWRHRRVIIAFDADAADNPSVKAARSQLSRVLIDRGATVGFLEWRGEEGKGIDDRIAKIGPERVLDEIGKVQFGDWRTRLIHSAAGKLLPCHENASLMLENDPEWRGVLGYNELAGSHYVLSQPPDPITARVGMPLEDHFDIEATRWFERKGLLLNPAAVRGVVNVVASRNRYHPVRDYLESLPAWDGRERIARWLITYCGATSSRKNLDGYLMAIGKKFLISAVARVMRPGCKADCLLVAEGPQGAGKSRAFRTLTGEEFFSDQLGDLSSKDASMAASRAWIIELSELGSLSRGELEHQKAFFSQQEETFRPPYGHRVITVPRQCVFVGTTNQDAWLKDETGGRRFWPFKAGKIDLAAIARDRDQLWAEALHAYRNGETWWIDDPDIIQDAIEEQRGRHAGDPWQDEVIKHAAAETGAQEAASEGKLDARGRGTVSVPEILVRLNIPLERRDNLAASRVARCLKAAGWEKFRDKVRDDRREWRYRRVGGE
jgi:hypothetical protein